MGFLVTIALALWFWFGNPGETAAEWFWPHLAAPWEKVDAFYYPNRNDLTEHRERRELGGLDACREAVRQMASEFDDATLERGDYECGVGLMRASETYGMRVYRITVR